MIPRKKGVWGVCEEEDEGGSRGIGPFWRAKGRLKRAEKTTCRYLRILGW